MERFRLLLEPLHAGHIWTSFLPHPSPLPKERESLWQRLGQFDAFVLSPCRDHFSLSSSERVGLKEKPVYCTLWFDLYL